MGAVGLVCDLCGSDQNVTVSFRARDYEYGVSGEWTIARCGTCHFFFQAPRPDPAIIPSFYPPSYSAYAEDPTTGWMFRVTYWLDARRVTRLIGLRGRILDVGCGDGTALLALGCRGEWDLWGVELDERAVAKAQSVGLKVERGDLTTCDLPANAFDLIRMGHVIEHVLDPLRTLQRAHDLLRPGGILFGETPNTDCVDFRIFHRYWGALHVPRHITLFDTRNLREALRRVGFGDIRILPRLRTVGWSAGIQNLLADRCGLRIPPTGRVRWYPLLIAACLPPTFLQRLFAWPATIAFVARKPGVQ